MKAAPTAQAAAPHAPAAIGRVVHRERAAQPTADRLAAVVAGPGRPLDPAARGYFAPRLGGLGDISVHPDQRAVSLLGARAVTIGRHIVFAPGQYRPDTPAGQRLLAHELVHTRQQTTAGRAPRAPAEREADRLAAEVVAGRSGRVGVGAGIAPAFALADYQNSMSEEDRQRHIEALSVSELQSDIDEISEFLDRQTASSLETGMLEQIRERLQARLATLLRVASAPARPPRPARRGRGRRATRAAVHAAPPTSEDAPRILREQRSVPTTDPVEARREVDRIVAWLQRADVTPEDRQILQVELATLAPQFEQARQADAARRHSARVQASLGGGGEGAEGLRAVIRKIESIYNDPEEPLAAFIIDGSERVRISREQAAQLRERARTAMRDALHRAVTMVVDARSLYGYQKAINDDSPVISRIAGWLGGVDDPIEAMNAAQGRLFDARYRALDALNSDNLSGAVDPLVEASTEARRIHIAVHAWQEGLISGAETAVTGLTFVRDCSAAIAIAIGAVVAAPFVAGAVGAGGLGLTGATASGATILGTGATVGTGAGAAFGLAEYAGQRFAGVSHDTAAAAATQVAEQRFGEGFAAGVGGGTTRVVSQALRPASTALGQFGTRAAAQGAGNFAGGTTASSLQGEDFDVALGHGARSAALGTISTAAGAPFARSPGLQTAVSAATSTGVGYLDARAQGLSREEALRSSAINLATIGVLHAAPGARQANARYQARGEQVGAAVRQRATHQAERARQAVGAIGIGIGLSGFPSRSGYGGSPLAPPRARIATIVGQEGEQPAPQAATRVQPSQAPVQPGAAVTAQQAPAAAQSVQPPSTQAPAPANAPATAPGQVQARVPVARNVEAAMGVGAAQRSAIRVAFSGTLTSTANAALGDVWNRVANPGEAATLTAANSRRLFNNHRNRFWREVRRDPAALAALRRMGAIFPEERNGGPINPNATSIPEINLPDGTRLRLSLDHAVERQTAPNRALDPGNLRLSTIRENTVVLRQLHGQDPFINPPPTWVPFR